MFSNWLFLAKSTRKEAGFSTLFWQRKFHPDAKLFEKEMKYIKGIRNDIAHSRKLFRMEDVRDLYKIARKWLEPLDVDINERIKAYRKERPKFLQELGN
jgi:hypothetical protein